MLAIQTNAQIPISKEQSSPKRSGPFRLSQARALLAVMMVTLGNVVTQNWMGAQGLWGNQ